MERLSDTAIAIINDLHTERLDYQSEYLPLIDAANRLATYEDSCLEPCDYAAMKAALEQADTARKDLNELIHIVGAAGIDHLRELVQAEKEGRLVVLPGKVGDTVFVIGKSHVVECCIDEAYLDDTKGVEYLVSFQCNEDCDGCPFNDWHQDFTGEYSCSGEEGEVSIKGADFGKTVFITREEAEAALKRMK